MAATEKVRPVVVDEEGAWFDRRGAAELMDVHPNTIRNWESQGRVAKRRAEDGKTVLVRFQEDEDLANVPATKPKKTAPKKTTASARKRAGAKKQASSQGASGVTVKDGVEMLPVPRTEFQQLLDKALGADEWAHRAGVNEEKSKQLGDRVRDLRAERDQAQAEAESLRGQVADMRVEAERTSAELRRVTQERDRLSEMLSPRQRKKVGM